MKRVISLLAAIALLSTTAPAPVQASPESAALCCQYHGFPTCCYNAYEGWWQSGGWQW